MTLNDPEFYAKFCQSRAVAGKPHDVVVKFDRPTYRNLQR